MIVLYYDVRPSYSHAHGDIVAAIVADSMRRATICGLSLPFVGLPTLCGSFGSFS